MDAMTGQAVKQLRAFGQSPWLDFIRRDFIADGSLAGLVANDGLGGVTSNPAIFQKALAHGDDYRGESMDLAAAGHDVSAIYETVAIADIQHAAEALRPVYDQTGGLDGFVSLEVSPYLARDEQASVEEARRLWATVDRPNLMVKVPGTPECVPAIRALIADGININVTLLFSQESYHAVAEAYLAGLEQRLAAGKPVKGVNSVASFFVSRIDSMIDAAIDRRLAAGDPDADALKAIRGKVAIANAKLAYACYENLVASPRWKALADAGAAPQRLLWASTGTKDKAYSDVLYIEELIGPDTVNTMPPATMDAFREHGTPRASLTENVDGARHILAEADRLKLDLPGVTTALVADGVQQFADAFDQLLGTVAANRAEALKAKLAHLRLPDAIQKAITPAMEKWRHDGLVRRLWQHDATLWTGADEGNWLGWLGIVQERLDHLQELLDFQADIAASGFRHVLLIGMGGSSLGPEVLGRILPRRDGAPDLHVLDSTDPQQIRTFESRLDLAKTLVIVSSKSGSTLEPNILKAYFFDQMQTAVGAENAGKHFVAVTDPGSHMQKVAESDKFRKIFFGDPQIGGRFSVLSNFGLVPAAAAGMDVKALLESAHRMVQSCGPEVPPAQNPGIQLGLALSDAHANGRDKLTILAEGAAAPFGAWLEQLIAESTGKHGLAIVPIDGETKPPACGNDRLFARIDFATDVAAPRNDAEITIAAPAPEDLGQLFFLWEFATAVAGTGLGIDTFNQPDVEASKLKTRALTDAYNSSGHLPPESPFATFGNISLFADETNAKALHAASLADTLRAHFARIKAGDYAAILAYIEQSPSHTQTLQTMRTHIGAKFPVATILEFGPRFLHSTGQAYKGGANNGVFLQITADHETDLPVPGERYSFGTVIAAQARGDFDVLSERGRRALRIHIGGDLAAGLAELTRAADAALG